MAGGGADAGVRARHAGPCPACWRTNRWAGDLTTLEAIVGQHLTVARVAEGLGAEYAFADLREQPVGRQPGRVDMLPR